ncbi:MAG TPA: ABC transporter permease [Rhodanobacteraceae bacterium]
MLTYYLELAWRRCRQNLWMVALLVLTMAIGIASCMTALTIFGALSGQPLPGISAHLYVATMDARAAVDKDGDAYSPASLLNLRDAKALVDAHKAAGQVALTKSLARVATLDGTHAASQVLGLMAYGPVLSVLGVPLRYGRPWTPAEQAARAPVVVIGSQLAEKLFGTADAVGKSVAMGKRDFRVIGVTASWKPRTAFLNLAMQSGSALGQPMQYFIPVGAALDGGVEPFTSGRCEGGPVITFQSVNVARCRWMEAWFALPSAAAVTRFDRYLTAYAQAQHAAGRFVYPPQARLYGTRAWMALHHVVPNDVRLNVILAGGFLLLCMVNVAGLLAARFLKRQGDVAIRRALGASKRQVFAQHLIEAGMLGLAGGLLALPLTLLGLWIVRMQPVGYAPAAQFGVGVFLVLLVLSLVVGLLVGMLPAWRVCRQPPALQIKVA